MNIKELRTPCYIIDEDGLKANLAILDNLRHKTGCRILLAQKAFSIYQLYDLMGQYLDGTTASGLYEARLAHEYMPEGENHVFSPAYRPGEIDDILSLCNHIVFNSEKQLELYGARAAKSGASVGLRINPECQTQEGHVIYDPCAPMSRLGVTAENMPERLPDYVEGIHFHTLCEQNSDSLAITLDSVISRFGRYLDGSSGGSVKWINLGGGHHITRHDYDIALLEELIFKLKDKYHLEVYLEPGEAVALNCGTLLTTVLETGYNGGNIAVIDASAACHMPDVIEMPYRPPLKDSDLPGKKSYTYRLGGPSCLAGDIAGDYSFDRKLAAGDLLEFEDMAIYTMVKTNTFNGIALPDIYLKRGDEYTIIRQFGYEDFKSRL